jgi:hypothetical protein
LPLHLRRRRPLGETSMRLALILFAVFLVTAMASTTLWGGVVGSISTRDVAAIGYLVVIPVFSSFLALWTAMTGKHPVWQVIAVLSLAVIWVSFQTAGNVTQAVMIPAILFFVTSSVPFLLLRGLDLALVDIRGPGHLARNDVSCSTAPADLRAVAAHSHNPLGNQPRSLLPLFASLLVVSILIVLFLGRVPKDVTREYVGWHWFVLAAYYAAVLPLTLLATLSTSYVSTAWAKVGLPFAIIIGVACLTAVCGGWFTTAIVVGPPIVCLLTGCGWLHIVGFRLCKTAYGSVPRQGLQA